MEKKNEERYGQACIDHRAKLLMPELTPNSRKIDCDTPRSCYVEGCPIYGKPKESKAPANKKEEPKDWGQGFKSDGTRTIPKDWRNPSGINLEVFEPIGGDEKPKKEKKISRETEDFLNMQASVISKLAWQPQIWKALYDLSTNEILDRLLGKTGLEGVAKHTGGQMPLKASVETKKLFENLEQQFAEEDEKKGKAPPPNYEDSFQLTWEEPHGFFDKGVYVDPKKPNDKIPKKEEKKDGKKTDKK